MSRVEIKHWDDNAMKTTPVVFRGRPGRTIGQYLRFLDEMDTKKLLEEAGKLWSKLP